MKVFTLIIALIVLISCATPTEPDPWRECKKVLCKQKVYFDSTFVSNWNLISVKELLLNEETLDFKYRIDQAWIVGEDKAEAYILWDNY